MEGRGINVYDVVIVVAAGGGRGNLDVKLFGGSRIETDGKREKITDKTSIDDNI